MRVGICTLVIGDEYSKTIRPCTDTQISYATKHSYDRITDISVYDRSRPISWFKIPLIQKYLSNYDYILWMDADVMVTNYDIKIETFIEQMQKDSFLLIARDLNNLNCGMFIIKNCEKSFEFLNDVWSRTEYINHPWWEQAAVIDIHSHYEGVQIIPRHLSHTFNGYDKTTEPLYPWVRGDWVIHFAGKRGDELIKLQNDYRYTRTFIIAKYKEDVSWASGFSDKRIYDKSDNPIPGSIPLPNVGRESDTYLRFIISNYDKLEDNIIFLQGHPFDHMGPTRDVIYTDDFIPFNTIIHLEPIDQYPGLHMRRHFRDILGYDAPEVLRVVYGAQFIVHRDRIINRPITFYTNLLSMLNNETDFDKSHYHNKYTTGEINGWIVERLWFYIFKPFQI